ncbi:MAG: hypothetical protein QOE61_3715, partial [Micromonosporaceae bacterium]|nr:hypothetical protein [Micromonosporaceae bacterium]
ACFTSKSQMKMTGFGLADGNSDSSARPSSSPTRCWSRPASAAMRRRSRRSRLWLTASISGSARRSRRPSGVRQADGRDRSRARRRHRPRGHTRPRRAGTWKRACGQIRGGGPARGGHRATPPRVAWSPVADRGRSPAGNRESAAGSKGLPDRRLSGPAELTRLARNGPIEVEVPADFDATLGAADLGWLSLFVGGE